MEAPDSKVPATSSPVMHQRLVFVGGLHKSGTSLATRCLASHPRVSGFRDTGMPEDEGQHFQSVYLPALAHGGPGKFGFDAAAHLTESSTLVTMENRKRLLAEWGPRWDLTKEVLLEKSPPNLIRTRFLQALFPEALFVIVMRHPVAVAYATQKWSGTNIPSLIEHWLTCHEIFQDDRPHIKRLTVVRYEDLVATPQGALNTIFSFLGVENVACDVAINPDVNTQYLRKWYDDSIGLSRSGATGGGDIDAYASRVAAFGYDLNAQR